MMTNTPPRLFKCILLILSVLLVSKANAQEISVSSFQLLENDLTANTYGTLQKDHNGEVAALIKIPTTVQGFTFDGGMVGIVKTEQRVGEIWVYVPHGIKRISIFHQQLGHLRDYYFPIPIEKARTYEMKVVTAQVQTITNVTVQQQFVVFQVEPKDASVEINDEILIVNEQGMATKRLPYGRYNYRVSSPNYHTQAGVLDVNAESKAMLQVDLKPNFGWIELTTFEEFLGAYVYLNGERIGQLPLKTDRLKSGTYRLRIMKSMYRIWEQDVEVKDNETTLLDVMMQPNFAKVTLQADDAASEIWFEGEYKGQGECTLSLEPGEYKAEVRRASHQSTSMLIQVNNTETKTISLPKPVPLYGSMEILSSPMGAKVYLDDALVGETPLLLNNILIGTHQLRFENEGYTALTQNAEVHHSQTASLNVSLEKARLVAQPKPEKVKQESPQTTAPMAEPTKTQKPRTVNQYHSTWSLYGSVGTILCELGKKPREYPISQNLSFNVGAYLGKFNVEYHYNAEQGFESQRYDVRLGYAFDINKMFVLTPQVGYGGVAGFEYDNYFLLDEGIILACRAQMCLGKRLAVAITPTIRMHDVIEIEKLCFCPTVSLIYNIPFLK